MCGATPGSSDPPDGAPSVRPVACVLRASLWAPIAWTLGISILLSLTASVSARQVRVGVLTDGPSARESISADAIEHAAAEVNGDGLTLTVAPNPGARFRVVLATGQQEIANGLHDQG
jgi:hypothetical protein